MGIFGKQCQSCGMPLAKDPLGGGTEANGTTNKEYCSHCYKNGQFVEPNITVSKMIDKVSGKMREMRIPGFLTKIFTRQIPKLQRWKS